MEPGECQLHCLQPIQQAPGRGEFLLHFGRRLRHAVRRRIAYLPMVARRLVARPRVPVGAAAPGLPLQRGDRVRVRSRTEILDTLNDAGELNGCGFMEEMARYCDTEQTVLKQMRRFLDEADYRIKRVRGATYLLEGVMCEGTVDWGPCDRSCFFFWREEWLERI